MKDAPKYGYYPWWPKDGNDWLHPEDVQQARRLIPSMRIFRRDGQRGPYLLLHYGKLTLRVSRTLWQEVQWEGYELGDWVEVLTRGHRNTPRTGVIREMLWDPTNRRLCYQIFEVDQPIAEQYSADDLRHVEPTTDSEPKG